MMRHRCRSYLRPSQPQSHVASALTLLLIGALLSSPSLPASNTHGAGPLLALAQSASQFLGDAASQEAEALVKAWSEAYGLWGESVLPPSAISLPPGVPAAPHLEDCARVSAEREAAERRGAGGEEPSWTQGAPRRAEAAAAGAGAAAAAAAACSGQEHGEGVPQPPWIRGPDAANLPLTRVVQRDIWRHQFPLGDCTDKRLLIAKWPTPGGHGAGSQVHVMSAMLSLAMLNNRVLVEDPDSYLRARTADCEAAAVGHNSRWDCYFFPITSVECRRVAVQQLITNTLPECAGVRFEEAAASDAKFVCVGMANSMESSAASLWGDAYLNTTCTVEAEGRLMPLAPELRKVHWWRAQAVRFIMRWPSAHLCHVTNQERHRAFGTLSANHVARFLQTQSEALSALSHSISASPGTATAAANAGATPAGANGTAAATDWEARRRTAADRLVALAASFLSFHPDPYATPTATAASDHSASLSGDAAAAAAAAAAGANGGEGGSGDNGNDAGWSMLVQEPYMPRPIASLHVRGTDKFAEMGLSSLDSHIFHMTRLRPHALHLQHVWLNTETQANIDQVKELASWTFFYSSNARQQDGGGGLRQYERDQSVAVSFASVLIAAQCDLFVGSLGSNWSRLMNELRSTNGRLLAGFVAVNFGEW
ncbi:hypothetical protein CLOM_g10870 [Closterium sp. NIES-68]|nr:hypothetical protein CLOM_g10870 [Closterium sp. NIES-68]GJP83391.1 hypothetical protein CLOP_g13551 [Closterium sp. NIES-67]